jgi:hypothetical protein
MPRQVDETHACRKFACQFQSCLKKEGFQNMDRCSREVKALKDCCRKFNEVSVHCAFPELEEVDDEGKPIQGGGSDRS